MTKLIAALVLFLAFTTLDSPVAAGPLEDGLEAYDHKDYGTALRLLRPLASNGNALAQNSLGLMYGNGTGVAQDFGEALKWFRKAAEQGETSAQFNLGLMYDKG